MIHRIRLTGYYGAFTPPEARGIMVRGMLNRREGTVGMSRMAGRSASLWIWMFQILSGPALVSAQLDILDRRQWGGMSIPEGCKYW
jgi:hypothetical protein